MEHKASFDCLGRYFTLGKKDNASQIWIVLHGYGQLARYFIRKFQILADQNVFIIAPEGLSRFYLEDVTRRSQGGDQRVGASWMTRENREMEIVNYLAFLNSVYQSEVAGTALPVTILGFSQGAATASRWVLDGRIDFTRLILWAGIFPPDLNFSTGHNILSTKKVALVYGTEDPFLNDDRFAEMDTLSDKLGITAERISFNGKHDIDSATLQRLT